MDGSPHFACIVYLIKLRVSTVKVSSVTNKYRESSEQGAERTGSYNIQIIPVNTFHGAKFLGKLLEMHQIKSCQRMTIQVADVIFRPFAILYETKTRKTG
jgi:hypothetical protein